MNEQIVHILPVVSEHINILGRYEFDIAVSSAEGTTPRAHVFRRIYPPCLCAR